ncbi:MAG: Fe-S cluster assembly protein SufD [Arenicella sp.]|jgi:Fe-S cluster assembly protein SufD
MITANENTSWVTAHADVALSGANIAWLNQQRKSALTQFEAVGLPGVRDEDWRYTNLRALKSNDYALSSASSLNIELADTTNPRLVFVDGHLDQAASTGLSDSVTSLKDSLEIVEAHFSSTLPKKPHGFTALNTAYAHDGYVVHLKSGQVLEGVLEVVFVSQSADAVSHTRNLIIADANTQCTIVERHVGTHGTVYLNNVITEVVAGDNAHVDHYKIQQESNDAFHMGGVFINQAKGAHVKSHNIALSGLVTRNDIHSNLLGQGAHVEMNGLVIGKGRQHVDNHTEVNHAVPNCTSDEYYKTVLDDHSRSVFRGRIIVAKDAQLTNADQQNNNLLLSKDAEADCKPQLEIYADDVKCSHGATVGQLDPVSLFYLKSRGIDAKSANALLTFAFANEVIERINVDSVRQELTQIIAGELLSGLEELV